MTLIDPTAEAYLRVVSRTNFWIAVNNAIVVIATGCALAAAAINDCWIVGAFSLVLLGAIKPFLEVPAVIRLVDPRNMRRIN
jgi:hypothetical protein